MQFLKFLFLAGLFGAAWAAPTAWAGINLSGLGTGNYKPLYSGVSHASTSCSGKKDNVKEADNLIKESLNVNLDTLKDKLISRIEDWSNNTVAAINAASTTEVGLQAIQLAELKKTQEAALTVEQNLMIQQNDLKNTEAKTPSEVETNMGVGLTYYRPELPTAFRQSEMQRYISELNNVPLDSKFRDPATGGTLSGYVDTSKGTVYAMGQEFRNFVRNFCDVRSLDGKMASTKFLAYNGMVSNISLISEYWCGQDRGLPAPNVTKNAKGEFTPLEGTSLDTRVKDLTNVEMNAAKQGKGWISLVNAPKNVSELYFEPRSLTVSDQPLYTKAEQEFARMVVGRAGDTVNTSTFGTGEGQRAFMNQQGRIAKLALARYPFAEMFAQKVPTLPPGSATWAADLLESNLDGCKNMPSNEQCVAPSKENLEKCQYKSLCDLSSQLRAKGQISESEFYDILFSRQFMGMSFSKHILDMSPGQLKRLQSNLMGLQLALGYQRNRLKEQQLALMAAIYAQQNR